MMHDMFFNLNTEIYYLINTFNSTNKYVFSN